MQYFFNKPNNKRFTIKHYPAWKYCKDGLNRNLNIVKDYYKSRIYAVKSNHFLCRLINSVSVPYSLPIDMFVDTIDAKTWNLSMQFKMTSSIYRGGIFSGNFYGSGFREIYISDSYYFNPFEEARNWQNINAVKVIYHTKSDIDLLLPNGRNNSNEDGLAILTINIPLLMLQYRCFTEDQRRKLAIGQIEGLLGVVHFIHMFVLPNMLDTQLDIALMNRFLNVLSNKESGIIERTHPFYYTKYDKHVDNVYVNVRDNLDREMLYLELFETIPSVVKENMREVLKLPNLAETRQVLWVEVLARIQYIYTVVKLLDKAPNKSDNNFFIKEIRRYMSDRSLENYLPDDIYIDIVTKMIDIVDIV